VITGRVTDQPEMIIRVVVRGPAGRDRRVKVVIDTSFDGALTLPLRLITGLKLPWHNQTSVELGDGSPVLSEIYRRTVEGDGRLKRVLVHGAETEPLLGMALLKGHHLDAEIRAGGKIIIERLPRRRERAVRTK
jgi:predicted aspartyl protease